MADEKQTQLADPMGRNMGMMGDMEMTPAAQLPTGAAGHGEVAMQHVGSVITAQKIAVPRDYGRLQQKLKALCAMNGSRYVYSWMVKDRQNNRMTEVSGPTIKLANDLAREFGNCMVDVRAFDEGEHIMFYARFVDLETGFSYTRPFKQDKARNVGGGMRDAGRRDDMVFQIGASKAIRNVVVNALQTFTDFMVEESRNKLVEWVENNMEKAANYIDGVLSQHSIELIRIEAVVGRKRKNWTHADTARVMAELRGVAEGLTAADEAFPTPENAAEVAAKKEADKADIKPDDPEKSKKKAAPKSKKTDTAPDDAAPGEQPDTESEDPEPEAAEDGAPLFPGGD